MKELTTVRLNLSRLDDRWIHKGKRGKHCDLLLIPTPRSPYDYSHMVVQGVSQKDRMAGKKGPIIGNVKSFKVKNDSEPA